METVEHGFVEIEGASIYYELSGTGPTIVLLHGFSFDMTVWDDQMEALTESYRVLRYDLRGFGRSTAGDVAYTHAGDLKALLDHFSISNPCLAGLSLGGGAVINFALMYPDYARAIILVAPSLGGFRWSERTASTQSSLQARVREKGIDATRELWLRQVIFRHSMNNKLVAARLRTMVSRYSGWHWLHADLGRPITPPAIERLSDIQIPTLILVGDADAPDQLQIADTLEQGIRSSKKIVFPGVGHLVNMEEPRLFNERVLEFLRSVKPKA